MILTKIVKFGKLTKIKIDKDIARIKLTFLAVKND